MCREIHLADLRLALMDCCDDVGDEEQCHVDDLLAEFEQPLSHAVEHGARAAKLAARGDKDAAIIHRALMANMAQAAMPEK